MIFTRHLRAGYLNTAPFAAEFVLERHYVLDVKTFALSGMQNAAHEFGYDDTCAYTDLFFTFQYTVYRLLIIW